MSIAFWRTAAFVLCVGLVAIGFYVLGTKSDTNKQAVEKSCVLLNNVIIRSATSAADPKSPQALSRAKLLSLMTDKERNQYLAAVADTPNLLQEFLVPCKEVADDPGSIKELKPVEPQDLLPKPSPTP